MGVPTDTVANEVGILLREESGIEGLSIFEVAERELIIEGIIEVGENRMEVQRDFYGACLYDVSGKRRHVMGYGPRYRAMFGGLESCQ